MVFIAFEQADYYFEFRALVRFIRNTKVNNSIKNSFSDYSILKLAYAMLK